MGNMKKWVLRVSVDGTWKWIPENEAKTITLIGVELPPAYEPPDS